MSAHGLLGSRLTSELHALPAYLGRALSGLSAWPRNPTFWPVQAMVVLITVLHYAIALLTYDSHTHEDFHHVAPVLYIVPIIYSSVRSRLDGALLTALWCGVLTLPVTILLRDLEPLEWLVQLTHTGVGILVALAVSRLVGREAEERRRAHEISVRLVELHRKVAQAHEEERRRIARELHARVVQDLVLVHRGLGDVTGSGGLPMTAAARVRELRATIDHVLADIRRYSSELRPSVLDDLGVVAALEWLASGFTRRQGVPVSVRVAGTRRRLPPTSELGLFRIAQEALSNVEQHAAASHVSIDLDFSNDRLSLRVCDDGRGFRPPPSLDDLVASGKLGLAGMRERAQLLGGTMEVQARVGQGTCIAVLLSQGDPAR